MTETFYDVLGVEPDATTDEIEAAYRERLKEVHPDVNDAADAGATTRELIDARDVLVDETERARYDRLGHEAYVGDEPSAASASESDVASAARRAGYGEATSTSGRQHTRSTAEDARERARARRERERRASERVRQGQAAEGTTDAGGSDASAQGTAADAASDSQSTATRASASRGGSGSDWNEGGGHSVRNSQSWGPQSGDWVPTGRDLTLLGLTFALYPVLLFSALVPAFPLFVNVVLGGCLLLVVGYLQSMPRIALLVFGPWSIVVPFVLLGLNLSFVSLVGIAVLLATWLPLGFTVLTISVLRR
jgi:curved DNA-binding protein CbpA